MILKNKRKIPLYIKTKDGKIYQSCYKKNGLHYCLSTEDNYYHYILDNEIVEYIRSI